MKAVKPSDRSADCTTTLIAASVIARSSASSLPPAAACTTTGTESRAGQRRVAGDLLGQPQRLVEGGAGLGQARDQAELVGPLGGDRLGRQDRLHRRRPPDRPREAEQASGAGHQVALDLGQPER